MSELKGILVKYYLPVFGFVIVAIIPAIISMHHSPEFATAIVFMVIFALLLTLILGFLNQKFGDKIIKRDIKKKLKNNNFKKFKSIGFVEHDTYLMGFIEGFLVTITPNADNFSGAKWIDVEIYFNPKQGANFVPQNTFFKIKSKLKKIHSLYVNSLHIKKNYAFKIPKYEMLYEMILESTRNLKEQQIQPISLSEWKRIYPETIEYYKHFNGLRIR